MNTDEMLQESGAPETIELIAGLITDEMGLADGICQIYNQRRKLPAVRGFFIDVAIVGQRFHAVAKQYVDDATQIDLTEEQRANAQEVIQIDIFSFDDSARLQKVNILFALTGTAAQQLSERWAMKIARLPSSFVDASEVQASKRLNRFAITFNVLRGYARQKAAPTFTEFSIPPKIITNQ